MTWKTRIILIAAIVLLAFGSYWYYWYNQTVKLRAEAEAVLRDSARLLEVEKAIEQEYNRCQEFIAQSEGDFGSFEYCKRFIDWVNKNSLR